MDTERQDSALPVLDVTAVDHVYVAVRDFPRSLRFYDGVFPIFFDNENIGEFVKEFTALRDHARTRPDPQEYANDYCVERLDRIVTHLEQLAATTGWSAILG